MQLLMIVYVNEMERSVRFYEALGLQREGSGEINGWWNAFNIGDAKVALHHNGGNPLPDVSNRLHLNIELPADGSLDQKLADCKANGVDIGAEIANVGFGRFFWVRDPDGLPVQFNERAAS